MRKYAITAAVALAAAAVTAGLTLATRNHVPKPARAQAGRPPLVLDLGVRTDPKAVALRRAIGLYDSGKVAEAAQIFAKYRSPEAEVGADFAAWPDGFSRLASLAQRTSGSSLVQLHYGLGLYWRGDLAGARDAWRTARGAQPDTPYALRAEDLLHPRFPRGLPTFEPSFPPPAALAKLSPPAQLAYLRSHATDTRGQLLLGTAYQRLGKQVSAVREFDRASGPEAEVAQAVGRFDKADPSTTFSRLGPLAKRYPKSQSVRFHLGLCLLWLGSLGQAKQELRQARDLGPKTQLGAESRRFLAQLAKVGSR